MVVAQFLKTQTRKSNSKTAGSSHVTFRIPTLGRSRHCCSERVKMTTSCVEVNWAPSTAAYLAGLPQAHLIPQDTAILVMEALG